MKGLAAMGGWVARHAWLLNLLLRLPAAQSLAHLTCPMPVFSPLYFLGLCPPTALPARTQEVGAV